MQKGLWPAKLAFTCAVDSSEGPGMFIQYCVVDSGTEKNIAMYTVNRVYKQNFAIRTGLYREFWQMIQQTYRFVKNHSSLLIVMYSLSTCM